MNDQTARGFMWGIIVGLVICISTLAGVSHIEGIRWQAVPVSAVR